MYLQQGTHTHTHALLQLHPMCATAPNVPAHLCNALQCACCCLADACDLVFQPAHALAAQLLLKEFGTQLACKQWNVLQDGQAHAPVFVLGPLLNCWQEALCKQFNADDLIDLCRR